ncbi:Rap1a/Tai family immunity protein [Kiloniella sp.]|uniref:Rap1a/Tai family immunity protein n=1 Tax=Kiloniella sp. TaxID=1938587 RepID=UPI003A94A484
MNFIISIITASSILASGTTLGTIDDTTPFPRPNTGGGLYAQCSPPAETPQAEYGGLYCSGYIMAIHDSLKERVDFCTYGDPTIYFIDQVMAYLKAHPEEWPQSAPALIRKVLIKENDC